MRSPHHPRPRGRKEFDLTVRKCRSALTNGAAIIANVDHRSATMRRFADVLHLRIADLGGEDAITEAEKSLARRASMLQVQCELMEARFEQQLAPPRPSSMTINAPRLTWLAP